MAETIAVLSLKGGTGKTTTVRTLTDVFRRIGLDVLCVDLDPQGNLSDYFDVAADATPTVADMLSGAAKAKAATHDGIIPASPFLAEVERGLSGKMGRELVLRKALKDPRKQYDVILIDCPPALGLLTINGLVAADWALISSEAQYFALQGVNGALEVVGQAKEFYNDDLEFLGVVMNIADMRTVHSRDTYAALRDLARRHDVILIDCPPALGLLTINAVVAADYALISTEAQYFSLQGVEQALEIIELAKENLHPDLEWLGVVMNIADMRTVHSREALAQLKERFGEKLFDAVIRQSIRYAESAERGVSILDDRPELGDDYLALAEEVLARVGMDEETGRVAELRAELVPA